MMYRKAGELAPDFSCPDSGTGAVSRLGALTDAGGETLLVWIKLGCPTCQMLMPFVERIHQQLARREDRRVVVVTQDGPTDVPRFRQQFRCATVPILCEAPPYAAADQYGITNTPTLFLLGADRRVLWSTAGFDRQGLEQLLDRLLGRSAELFTADEALALPAFRPG